MGITFSSFPIRGIDVSHYNGTINWSLVQAHFAGIRVGYGRILDTKFRENWQNAKGKVKRFPYWYMDYYSNQIPDASGKTFSDIDWGKLQAENCWAQLNSDPEGIVFLDIENGGSSFAPPIATVAARAQAIAKAFLERMDALNGKKNGVYCSMSMLNWFSAWFKDRPLWVAWYNETQTNSTVLAAVGKAGWTGKCLVWQYASDGDINNDGIADGITMGIQYKFLDLDGWLGTDAEFNAFFSGIVPEKVELYKVTTLINNLLVRSGPGILEPRLRRADFPAVYSIYAEKNGYGLISPTLNEWISLSPNYVKRVTPAPVVVPVVVPAADPVLYQVKILINNLSVRSGPGILYSWLRRADFPGLYGIYEEKNGFGRISADKKEWINLSANFVQKLSAPKTLTETEKVAKLWSAHPELH
ncbi:MAG: glycoside hydrolase family 25 protein [Anaerolineaceae bacterium]